MSDIFHEIEEDVRRELYERLWKKYGYLVIAAAAAAVVGVAAWQWYQSYHRGVMAKASDTYEAADALVSANNYAKAEADFAKLAQSGPGGYAIIARFREAEMLLAQGKTDQAATVYRELGNASDTTLAASARLRLAWLEVAGSTRTQLEKDLEPLRTADSSWRFMAAEVLAFYDLGHGARGAAETAYQGLAKAAGAPQGVRVRAAAIAEFLAANPNDTLAVASPVVLHAPTPDLPTADGANQTPASDPSQESPAR